MGNFVARAVEWSKNYIDVVNVRVDSCYVRCVWLMGINGFLCIVLR